MANSVQARKRARQATEQRAHNMSLRSSLRTAIKKVRKAIDAGDKTAAQAVFKESQCVIDSIADKKFKSMITMDTFNLLMYRMAEVLMKHVSDPEVLERIQLDWAKISVETRAGGRKQLASAGNAE